MLLGLSAPMVAEAEHPSLTGTWEGLYTCKEQSEGLPYSEKQSPSVLEITDLGDGDVRMTIDGSFPYVGAVASNAKKADKIAGTFVHCSTSPGSLGYGEMMSASFNTKPTQAKFKGVSVWGRPDAEIYAGTCKYIYKRVGTVDPNIGPCS